jgi:hypothetical protein
VFSVCVCVYVFLVFLVCFVCLVFLVCVLVPHTFSFLLCIANRIYFFQEIGLLIERININYFENESKDRMGLYE